MFRIGLTGGIAAGKSIVARRLREHGATLVDHDTLAREAVRPGSVGLDRLVEHFGDEIVQEDGSLDRAALAHVVFGDHDELSFLNSVVHPEVQRLSAEREAATAAADPEVVIVHDIPLLVETGQAGDFHLLVVVDAPVDLRISRLVEQRGMALPEARRRVAAQVDDETRRGAADILLDGTGTPEHLAAQTDELWSRLHAEAIAESQAAAETLP